MLNEIDAVTQLYNETQRTKGQHIRRNTRKVARNILQHKQFECSHCTKRFATKIQQRAHLYRQQYKVNWVCCVCNRSYSSNALLNEHLTRHFPQTIKFRCAKPECGKGFLNESKYKQHIMTHGGFRCYYPQCGKRFASRYNLDEHIKKHLNLLAYHCDVCPGKSFSNQFRLNAHKKTDKHADWKHFRLNNSNQQR